jgi:hypothetical protein
MVLSPSNTDCPKREHSFALTHPKRKTVYFATSKADELEKWRTHILSVGVTLSGKDGENLPPKRVTGTLRANSAQPGKMTLKTRLEKYVASKVVDTKVGMEIIETFFGDSGLETMEAVHDFTAAQSNEENAQKMEKNVLKMASKIAVLIRNGVINDQQLLPIIPTTIAFCKSFISLYGSYTTGNKQIQTKEEHVAALIQNGWLIEEWLQNLIKPHLRETSSERVKSVFSFYLDEEILYALLLPENQDTTQVLLDDVIDIFHKMQEGRTE